MRHAKAVSLVSRLSQPSVCHPSHILTFWYRKRQMLWQENLNTRPNTQAKAERSNTVHADPCQASVVSQTCSSELFSLPPILSNVKTSFEAPSLYNSTVLLTVKHCFSMQLSYPSPRKAAPPSAPPKFENEWLRPCSVPVATTYGALRIDQSDWYYTFLIL